MKVKQGWKNQARLAELLIFFVLLVSYTYFFPRWADPNQNSRMDMIVAVVDEGTLQIDQYVANTVDYARVGDHYYSDKAPGTAFLGIPLYAGLKWILQSPAVTPIVERLSRNAAFAATLREGGSGIYLDKVRFAIAQVALTFVISILPSAFLGVLLYRVLRKFARGGRSVSNGLLVLVALGYGLITPAFAYSGAFYGHQLTAAILFAVFYGIFQARDSVQTSPLRYLAIGFLLGLSVITEYPTALIAGVLFLYLVQGLWRSGQLAKGLWAIAGGLPPVVGWMIYNNAVFGGPLTLGYDYSAQWQVQHHTGFMSLTVPHLDAVWGLTFGVFRGLFFLSPVLLLAIPSFVAWWQSRRYRAELFVALASLGLTFLFNSSSSMWWGGFAVGPRYLLPALPFMILPFVFGLERWWHWGWVRALSLALAAWSFIATWGLTLAGQAFPSDAIFNPLLEYALPNWIAGNIARNFGTVLGLRGSLSLLPLLVVCLGMLLVWFQLGKAQGKDRMESQSIAVKV